jgi:pimeloyl-ACP methyl ester carboxylesterase
MDAALLDTHRFAGASLPEINSWASTTRPGMRILTTQAAQVRVRVAGDKRAEATVVVLPDGPNLIEHYDDLIATLGPRVQVIALEIPGFGFSWATDVEALTFPGAVGATADALQQLRAEFSSGPLIMTGVCVQAYIALALAGANPELVDGLMLLQASDWESERHWLLEILDPAGALRTPWTGQAAWRLNREELALGVWYPMAAPEGYDLESWRTRAHEAFAHHCSYALASLTQLWYANGFTPDFSPVSQPTTVVWGTADRSHLRAGTHGRTMLQHVPHAHMVELDGAAHFPDVEKPEEFARQVDALLKRVKETAHK